MQKCIAVILATAGILAMARTGWAGGGSLSAAEIHAIAWPAARAAYNEKYSPGSEASRRLGGDVESLAPDAYSEPTSVVRRGDTWVVLYGGQKSGPAIRVIVDDKGQVTDATAVYPGK